MGDHEIRSLERQAEVGGEVDAAKLETARARLGIVSLTLGEIEARALAEIKARNPRSRLRGILYYSTNTSARRAMSCALCGQVVSTWSGNYPKTVTASGLERDHFIQCLTARASRYLLAGESFS